MHAAVPFTVTDKRMTLNANVSLSPFSTSQQLSSALNRNELSAEELLMATVERIEAVNPTVNAIVAMDVDAARKAARESDERRGKCRPRAARRHNDDREGQHRCRGISGHVRLSSPGKFSPELRRAERGAIETRRRHDRWQIQLVFDGNGLPVRQSAFQYYAQPLEPGDDVRRFFGRRGGGLGCRHDTAGVR